MEVKTPSWFGLEAGRVTRVLAVLLFSCAALGFAGCNDDDDDKKLKITAEPADATVNVGTPATFSVTVDGKSPTYQWQRNGAAIAGASSATYTTPATVAADHNSTYSVVVTRGNKSVMSRAAVLTVNVPPAITTQPANAAVDVGATATFTVAATGRPAPTYQWRRNATNIAGATSASYTTPATTNADNGAQYSVVVTNSLGAVTSTAATLTLTSPAAITTQPANQTVTAPAAATFTAAASGSPTPTWQWQVSSNGTSWTNVSGATSASYTTPATTNGDDGKQYRVVASNSRGYATSLPATLTVTSAGTGGGWSTATFLQPANPLTRANRVRVAAGANGEFVATWYDSSTDSGTPVTLLRSSRYTPGSGWQPAVTIYTAATQVETPEDPFVGMDAGGTATVTWMARSNGSRSLWYSRSGPNGQWSTPALVETEDGGDVDLGTVAVGADGTVVAVWQQNYTNFFPQNLQTRRVVARVYVPGQGWGPVADIDFTADANGTGLYFHVSVNASGDAVVGWTASTTTGQSAAAALLRNGAWSPAAALTPFTGGPADVFGAYMNDAGDAAVSGRYSVANTRQQFVARRSAGAASWPAAEMITTNVPSTGGSSVVLASDGTATVVWQQSNGFGNDIYAARAAAGGSWSAAQRLSTLTTDFPVAGIDAQGNVIAAWAESPGNFWTIRSARYSPGGSWVAGANEEVEVLTSSEFFGSLAVSDNGTAVLGWAEAPQTGSVVPWANRFE